MASIPEWLSVRPSDFLNAAKAGTEAGLQSARLAQTAQAEANQAAEASARLSQQERLAIMDTQVRQEIAQQAALRQQQELEIDRARVTAMSGLQRAQLQEKQDIAAAKAKEAALRYAHTAGFAAEAPVIGVGPALHKYPMTEATTVSAVARSLPKAEKAIADKFMHVGGNIVRVKPDGSTEVVFGGSGEDKPINVRHLSDTGDIYSGPLNSPQMRAIMGTNAPPMIAPPAASASPYKEGQFIRNKKDGKMYRVTNGVPQLISHNETPAPTPDMVASNGNGGDEDTSDEE